MGAIRTTQAWPSPKPSPARESKAMTMSASLPSLATLDTALPDYKPYQPEPRLPGVKVAKSPYAQGPGSPHEMQALRRRYRELERELRQALADNVELVQQQMRLVEKAEEDKAAFRARLRAEWQEETDMALSRMQVKQTRASH